VNAASSKSATPKAHSPRIVLPTSARPRASILIPADRNAELLARCLESVARNAGPVPFELIVVLNASSESVIGLVRERVDGVQVLESDVNRGVGGAYNLARDAANGEFIVLLHDDAEVWPGWLEWLVKAAEECPEAGAVGSRAFNANGTLQAAGSIVWRDGTTRPIGAGERADSSAYAERRAVDFCGSVSLLVRAETWDAVDGLDERFYPASYVDVDLCMKVRQHGQVVLCEPRSQITHYRWGVEMSRTYRHWLARHNQKRFAEKWQAVLQSHVPRAEENMKRAMDRHQQTTGENRHDTPANVKFSSEVDYLRAEVELQAAYIAELERLRAEAPAVALEAEELRARVTAIESSRTWRLRRRLLPLLRALSRTARI
jgi:GT2 family glycosyltransferase